MVNILNRLDKISPPPLPSSVGKYKTYQTLSGEHLIANKIVP